SGTLRVMPAPSGPPGETESRLAGNQLASGSLTLAQSDPTRGDSSPRGYAFNLGVPGATPSTNALFGYAQAGQPTPFGGTALAYDAQSTINGAAGSANFFAGGFQPQTPAPP